MKKDIGQILIATVALTLSYVLIKKCMEESDLAFTKKSIGSERDNDKRYSIVVEESKPCIFPPSMFIEYPKNEPSWTSLRTSTN